MTRIMLAAGVAALAIAAPAASAPHGGGHGKAAAGQQRGGGHAQQARGGKDNRVASRPQRAERASRSQRAQSARVAERGHARVKARERVAAHAPARAQARSAQRAHANRERAVAQQRVQARSAQRANAHRERAVAQQRVQVRNDRARAFAERQKLGRNNNPVIAAREHPFGRIERGMVVNKAQLARAEARQQRRELRTLNNRVVIPVARAQTLLGEPVRVVRERVALNPLPVRLRSVYYDTPDYYYQYGSGYAYRIDRDTSLVSALLPLFGLGYGVGQTFPAAYSNYYMPSALQPFYPSTPYASYRYAGCYTYRIDPITGMIIDTIPTYAYGCGFGQMLPASYGTYNIPYQYRPYYADTSDYYYRYAPGAIYQVDPSTSLITAVAALLTGGLNVGQQLPVGYSAYNVPLSYRARYYDTPDAWYRYADGYIYRVNPATGLVTQRVVTVV
jgi:hypothetical protein